MPSYVVDEQDISTRIGGMINEFNGFIEDNKFEPIAIMPLKLFRLDLIPVNRNTWQRKYNRSKRQWELPDVLDSRTYVDAHKEYIVEAIKAIKLLEPLSQEEQITKLNEMYPWSRY